MDFICHYDQTPLTLSKEEMVTTLLKMYAKHLHHHEVVCPRCGRANAISLEDLERAVRGREETTQAPARIPATSPAPAMPSGPDTRMGDRLGRIITLIAALATMLFCIANELIPWRRFYESDRSYIFTWITTGGEEGNPRWYLAKPLVCGDRNLKIVRLPLKDNDGQLHYTFASFHAYCASNGLPAAADVILQVRLVTGAIEGAILLAALAVLWFIIMIIIKVDQFYANKTAATQLRAGSRILRRRAATRRPKR